MVSYEYVASQLGAEKGVLVLSEFAGAAQAARADISWEGVGRGATARGRWHRKHGRKGCRAGHTMRRAGAADERGDGRARVG